MTAQPVYFGPRERSLAGWLHLPPSGRARGGVLICGPVAREHTVAYPSLRLLAEQLAETGLASLRLDYDGTGDSAGGMGDRDRLHAWQSSIRTGLQFLRSTGVPAVSVVGLRLGALLAITALPGEQLASFVAWDPQLRGRRFLREQQVLASVETGPGGEPTKHDGAVHGFGAVFPAELGAELTQLRVDPHASPVAQRFLLAHRPYDVELLSSVKHLGVELTTLELHDQEQMLEGSPTRPATAAVQAMVDYLDSWHPGRAGPVRVPPHRLAMQVQDREGRQVVERFWHSRDGQLFGVACSPPDEQGPGPRIVFLPSGLGHRVGLGNLWVDLARECAAQGLSSVRVDLSGLGDSSVRPGHVAGEVYTQAAVDDIVQVARDVAAHDPSAVHLVGHCSSAWAALRAAEVLRPRSVHAVHYLPFAEWQADVLAPTVTERTRVRTLLTRARRSGLLPSRADVPAWMWILLDRAGVWPSPMRLIAGLVAAGTRVQVLSDDVEAGYFVSVRHRALRKLPASRFEIEVMPVRDHALSASRTRQHVARSLLSSLKSAQTPAADPPRQTAPGQVAGSSTP